MFARRTAAVRPDSARRPRRPRRPAPRTDRRLRPCSPSPRARTRCHPGPRRCRRFHDLRRTGITLYREDGADRDILRRRTHGAKPMAPYPPAIARNECTYSVAAVARLAALNQRGWLYSVRRGAVAWKPPKASALSRPGLVRSRAGLSRSEGPAALTATPREREYRNPDQKPRKSSHSPPLPRQPH